MMKLITISFLAAVAMPTVAASQQAPARSDQWSWLSATENNIKIKQSGIEFLERGRDTACTDAAYRETCLGSYNFCITRRQVEEVILKDWLARKVYPGDAWNQVYNEMDALTTLRCEKVVREFPPAPPVSPKGVVDKPTRKEALEQPLPQLQLSKEILCYLDRKGKSICPDEPKAAPLNLPVNGPMRSKGRSAIAQFNVRTPAGNDHYVIKLVSEDSRKEEIAFFIRANSHFEGKVPLGRYRVVGVHGQVWLGWKEYFGDNSTFFKVVGKPDNEEVVNFYKDKTVIHGKTLTLKGVVDGNATTPPIDRAEFENN